MTRVSKVEANCLTEVFRCPELVVPSAETNCNVVRRARSKRVPLRAKVQCFSGEDNGLLKVPSRSQLAVMKPERHCEPRQTDGSLRVAGWARFKCFTIKVDRLLDVTGPPSLLKLGDKRFRARMQLFNWGIHHFRALRVHRKTQVPSESMVPHRT